MKKIVMSLAVLFASCSVIMGEVPKELLETDIQYYNMYVKNAGVTASINYLYQLIKKYKDKGIEPLYLIPVEEELSTLRQTGKMPVINDTKNEDKFKFEFGPKGGYFFPHTLTNYHGNILAGADVIIWNGKIGCRLEFEKYLDKYKNIQYSYNYSLGGYSAYVTKYNLNMTSGWFSVMYKTGEKLYEFIGAGFGIINARESTSGDYNYYTSYTSTSLKEDYFLGYQLLTGIGYKIFALEIKYNSIGTNNEWSNTNLGGIAATLNFKL